MPALRTTAPHFGHSGVASRLGTCPCPYRIPAQRGQAIDGEGLPVSGNLPRLADRERVPSGSPFAGDGHYVAERPIVSALGFRTVAARARLQARSSSVKARTFS